MTPEQKIIAIAKACGWRGISEQFLVGYAPWRTKPYSDRVNSCPISELDSIPLDPLPDYFNDLNAMQSSVQSQSERFQNDFDSALKNSGKWVASMTAQEWADIFILCFQSQRDSINSTP